MLQFLRKNKISSPNHGERRGGQTPSILLIHYTGMKDAQSALERLCDPASEVSAHYMISETGEVHNLVPEDRRAWHAGASYWAGGADINSASIGIELVNPGHEFGYRAFPEHQIKSLVNLAQGIIKRHNIPSSRVLGHSDVAPGRKEDPGELFPWEALASHGIGLWPKPLEVDYQAAEDIILDEVRLKGLLSAYGYNPDLEIFVLITAFHRHFYPEKLAVKADILSVAKLLSLVRQASEK